MNTRRQHPQTRTSYLSLSRGFGIGILFLITMLNNSVVWCAQVIRPALTEFIAPVPMSACQSALTTPARSWSELFATESIEPLTLTIWIATPKVRNNSGDRDLERGLIELFQATGDASYRQRHAFHVAAHPVIDLKQTLIPNGPGLVTSFLKGVFALYTRGSPEDQRLFFAHLEELASQRFASFILQNFTEFDESLIRSDGSIQPLAQDQERPFVGDGHPRSRAPLFHFVLDSDSPATTKGIQRYVEAARTQQTRLNPSHTFVSELPDFEATRSYLATLDPAPFARRYAVVSGSSTPWVLLSDAQLRELKSTPYFSGVGPRSSIIFFSELVSKFHADQRENLTHLHPIVGSGTASVGFSLSFANPSPDPATPPILTSPIALSYGLAARHSTQSILGLIREMERACAAHPLPHASVQHPPAPTAPVIQEGLWQNTVEATSEKPPRTSAIFVARNTKRILGTWMHRSLLRTSSFEANAGRYRKSLLLADTDPLPTSVETVLRGLSSDGTVSTLPREHVHALSLNSLDPRGATKLWEAMVTEVKKGKAIIFSRERSLQIDSVEWIFLPDPELSNGSALPSGTNLWPSLSALSQTQPPRHLDLQLPHHQRLLQRLTEASPQSSRLPLEEMEWLDLWLELEGTQSESMGTAIGTLHSQLRESLQTLRDHRRSDPPPAPLPPQEDAESNTVNPSAPADTSPSSLRPAPSIQDEVAPLVDNWSDFENWRQSLASKGRTPLALSERAHEAFRELFNHKGSRETRRRLIKAMVLLSLDANINSLHTKKYGDTGPIAGLLRRIAPNVDTFLESYVFHRSSTAYRIWWSQDSEGITIQWFGPHPNDAHSR